MISRRPRRPMRRRMPKRDTEGRDANGAFPVQPASGYAPGEENTAQTEPATSHGWTSGQHLGATAVRSGLWVAVLCGPAALVANLVGPSAAEQTAVAQTAPSAAMAEQAAVGEFAARYVDAWIETTDANASDLDNYTPVPDTVVWPDEKSASADNAAVSSLSEQPNGLWSVTVGVDVEPAEDGPVERRYFQTTVAYDDGKMASPALPSPVSTPANGKAPGLAYQQDVASDSSAGKTVADFLDAYATGAGELSRYITPGVSIRPISPAPYKKVELLEVASTQDLLDAADKPDEGQQAHIVVTATGELDGGAAIPLQYAMTLSARDGRWEVTGIDPTPRVSETTSPTSDALTQED